MFDFLRKLCLATLLLFTTTCYLATDQDYDWSDQDLPEWLEDVGYEDADYDGPDLGAANRTCAKANTANRSGRRRCSNCKCNCCRDPLNGRDAFIYGFGMNVKL